MRDVSPDEKAPAIGSGMAESLVLPNFLIVGAMKSGTTSLYRDLQSHPDIFLPEHKEPEAFSSDAVLRPGGRADYAALFKRGAGYPLRGEASTGYTKRPEIDGVAARARAVLGPDVRLVYVVREPIGRMVSHYHHDVALGRHDRPLNEALLELPRYVDFSRYAYQLEPWFEAFGPERVLVLNFERYVADRPGGAATVCRFLGLDPEGLSFDPGQRHNATRERPVPRSDGMRAFMNSRFYQRHVKPRVPWSLRRAVARVILARPEVVEQALLAETEAELRARLSEADFAVHREAR